MITALSEHDAHKLHPGQRLIWLCHRLGIRHQSNLDSDYQTAVDVLTGWNLPPDELAAAIEQARLYVYTD